MIAQRFRSLGWVATIASAATGLYLISLQVAVERGKLEAVEAQIAAAQREVRQLQTEIGTRASMRQLERWNGDVLALSAPKASQFVNSGAQLVALDLSATPALPNNPPPVMASIAVPKPVDVSVPAQPVATAMAEQPKPQKVAMLDTVAALDIASLAALESRQRP